MLSGGASRNTDQNRTFGTVRVKVCYADFSDIRFSYFADAAFARVCGMLVAAMQHVSPKRPFNRDIRGQIQTVLSLRDAGTNERRTKHQFAAFA
jgi:hypothetical protein